MKRCFAWLRQYQYKVIAIIFWIAVWQGFSMWIDKEIFLPSPVHVFSCLVQFLGKGEFWRTVAGSIGKISAGFFLAVISGAVLAAVTYPLRLFKEIVVLGMNIIKSIPVASFVILSLLWVKAENLSMLMAFLMVLPIIYINTLNGIASADGKLIEMAKVFHMNGLRKFKFIYLPATMPYFISGVTVGLGFCWKSGIAAEVISIARNSIGGKLYEAKIYLNTRELFAWTIVIIAVSAIFEKIMILLLRRVSGLISKES